MGKRGRPREAGRRDWSSAAIRIAGSPRKRGQRPELNSPSESPEGTNSADIFWTPGLQKCERRNFPYFKPPGLWEFDTAA